jgi:protein-S-isoprenylcysteine O-methyltransferase Ste14
LAGTDLPIFGTIIFTILVPGTATVVVPYLIITSDFYLFSVNIGTFRFSGIILVITGILAYLWTAFDFAISGKGTPAPVYAPRELVAKGLYRYVRNPMYLGVLSILTGEAFLFETVGVLIFALFMFLVFHLFIVFYEEPVLLSKFGVLYENYCDTVPRWIPRFRKK